MSKSRRQFINTLNTIVPGAFLAGILPGGTFRSWGKDKVDGVTLYLTNVQKARNFSHSTWHNRQHIFIKIQSGRHSGWAEALANKNNLDFDIANWGRFFNELKGMSVAEAIDYSRNKFLSGQWVHKMSEPALMALYDVLGKGADKPTIELWGLDERKPVPGLFCILEKDVNQALVQAEIAKQQHIIGHVKVKFFGIPEIDMALTRALRSSFGPDTFLLADANRGYKDWVRIDEMAEILKEFHAAGLNAMEDPAALTKEQWIELQSKVDKFALIPDRPMRPAYKALELYSPEMGAYFNIHPDTMGTFKEAIELGKRIKSDNRGLMIGDSSLIGPACTFWQQVAIGLGASWVEALEKPQESDVFQQCVKQISTTVNSDGNVEIINLHPGFGIEMNEAKLKELADKFVQLF
jgi:L-alanine-DL-glutamate epimerase-like enolase superfamily enzyme